VPARHASGITVLARLHSVAKGKSRVVYVSVKTIHLLCDAKKKPPTKGGGLKI